MTSWKLTENLAKLSKGCFSRSPTCFVYIQILITISSPWTRWSKGGSVRGPLFSHICTWRKTSFTKFVISLLLTRYYLRSVITSLGIICWRCLNLLKKCVRIPKFFGNSNEISGKLWIPRNFFLHFGNTRRK